MNALPVLIVEDDKAIAEEAKYYVEGMDYECVIVHDRTSAIEKLKNKKFSFILLDLEIPKRYGSPTMMDNGEAVLSYIRERRNKNEQPVIIMTSHGIDDPNLSIEMMEEHDANSFIHKPFVKRGKRSITNVVQRVLQKVADESDDDQFYLEGQIWKIKYNGKTISLKHSLGLAYIHYLITHPNEAIPCHTLQKIINKKTGEKKGAEPTGSDDILDQAAIDNYKLELDHLNEDMEEAKKCDNLAWIESIQKEEERIKKELFASTQPSFKPKKLDSDLKKSNDAVAAAIKRALKVIERENKEYYLLLMSKLVFGREMIYK